MNPPILEAEEIPYDPADMGPGSFGMEIEFNRDEMERLKARSSRGSEPLGRFIKRAALEAADREARDHASDDLREAD
jgi:hypothetical protein